MASTFLTFIVKLCWKMSSLLEARPLTPQETVIWLKTREIVTTAKGRLKRLVQNPQTQSEIRQAVEALAQKGEVNTPQRITATFVDSHFPDFISASQSSDRTALATVVQSAQMVLGPVIDRYPQIKDSIETDSTQTINTIRDYVKSQMEENLRNPENYNNRLVLRLVILGAETAAELYNELFPQIQQILEPPTVLAPNVTAAQ